MSKYVGARRFIRATGTLGGGSVVLSVVLFGVSIYEHLVARNLSAYWLVFAAGIFFAAGAFRAWANSNRELAVEIHKNTKPPLDIEIVRAFFDVSRIANTNQALIHIYIYSKVTNLAIPRPSLRMQA